MSLPTPHTVERVEIIQVKTHLFPMSEALLNALWQHIAKELGEVGKPIRIRVTTDRGYGLDYDIVVV